MIQRTRNVSPAELNKRHTEWVIELADDPASNPQAAWRRFSSSHASETTKEGLMEMYDNKCCFCEHKVTSCEIEHFKPKHAYQANLFAYNNLHLICSACNRIKGVKDVDDLIDPSTEDPSIHLNFRAERMKDLTEQGCITINTVGLNRLALSDLRQADLNSIERDITRIVDSLDREVSIGSLRTDLLRLEDIRGNNFSISSQFSKMFRDNLEKKIITLEEKINSQIIAQEAL